ncbi:MAG: efflux RND transporter periplasmic adaptor subunit [Gemmataceae bacterium]|nr:efflux RND transporter periplasmic adaptor subunit [Gemmataceae bacterium]MDW8264584.1 efflux RND transporter periplasmic adaptor subunit [Gemmataceae bacterium]
MNLQRLSVLVIVVGVVLTGCGGPHPSAVPTPPPVVLVARPVERTVTEYDIYTARTQAVQYVDIKPRVTGYLTKIHFKDGDLVKAGDLLFEIDDRPYKAQLDEAKGDVDAKAGAVMKTKALLDIGLATQKENVGAISQQEIERRRGDYEEAKGALEAAKAARDRAQLFYDWCRITSPISGRINRHFVDVGNLVTQDFTLLTNIVSLQPMWAYFDVDENSLIRYQALIQEGAIPSPRKTQLPVQLALGTDSAFPFHGFIDFVSNQVDPNVGSIRVRAVFPNDDGKLLPGLFGRVRVPASRPHSALLVQPRAIGVRQTINYVLVVNDQDEVEYREVELGGMHDGLREVLRERRLFETDAAGNVTERKVVVLKPTDRIIVDGVQRVRAGARASPRLVDMETLLPRQSAAR